MFCNYIFVFVFINLALSHNSSRYLRDTGFENSLACPANRECIPVDYCSDMVALLNEATLPIHRFRQAICGYVGKNPKVCCNTPRDTRNFLPNYPSHPVEPPRDCGSSFVRSSAPTIGSYPFLARIGFMNINDGNLKYSCTGTIINERTVLTTATCALASASNYKLHSVLVGEFDTAQNPDCNQLLCAHCTRSYNISYIVKHPNFQHESYDRNIALIRLVEPITPTLTAQPICYSNQQYLIVGSTPMLVGWGKLSRNRDSTEQQSFAMRILNRQDCGEFLNQGLSVELCAIGHEEPCSGFSGSPLIYNNGRGRHTVVGILSYGSKCNPNENSPSVFVNIEKYATWISDNS